MPDSAEFVQQRVFSHELLYITTQSVDSVVASPLDNRELCLIESWLRRTMNETSPMPVRKVAKTLHASVAGSLGCLARRQKPHVG